MSESDFFSITNFPYKGIVERLGVTKKIFFRPSFFFFYYYFFAVLNTFKIFFRPSILFSLLVSLGCPTCIFFTENVTIASSVIGSTTYEILFSTVKQFLSYSANRQTQFFSINYCFYVVQPAYFSLKILPSLPQ